MLTANLQTATERARLHPACGGEEKLILIELIASSLCGWFIELNAC